MEQIDPLLSKTLISAPKIGALGIRISNARVQRTAHEWASCRLYLTPNSISTALPGSGQPQFFTWLLMKKYVKRHACRPVRTGTGWLQIKVTIQITLQKCDFAAGSTGRVR
ncbi:MAG: hypothetical protein KDI27_08655, partial [Gammaproteobacteria bacterium]|nr:hypothetical protein [Gammaproteobacteria bacterium]